MFRLTPTARSSLRAIAKYTEQNWGIVQRDLYIRMLDKCFHELAVNPKKGRLREELKENLRCFKKEKHVIFYITEPKQIVILNILHERMDPALHL